MGVKFRAIQSCGLRFSFAREAGYQARKVSSRSPLRTLVRSVKVLLRCPLSVLLYEPFTDDLIDCRFHEASADSLSVTVTFAVIRNDRGCVGCTSEFLNRFGNLRRLPMAFEFCALQIYLHKLQMLGFWEQWNRKPV